MTQNSNGVIILITLLNILVYKLQQLQEAKFTEQTNQLSLALQRLCRRFSLRDIKWATFNFNDELVIGQGGFGKVYRGIIDFGASIVAIKRLKSTSKQGSKEFLTEIEMLSKFQHSHVVSLVGYCDDCHEMILVYEYMPCGTLADHLHKRVRNGDTSSPPLSWEQRLKICIGAARGLEYLHTGTSVQHRVIHRDVKSSNILLDENMAAKISDFGLSKIGPSNQAFSTYVSTRVKGTPGYMDPYYFETLRLTRKSDVYGFGVVLFEVLCGRPAVDNSLDDEQRGLAGWAQHCFKEGLLDQIIDPTIKGEIFPNSLVAFVRVAIQCLHNGPKHRPTMAEVVVGLESALGLQQSSTIYILPEVPLTNCSSQVNVNANSSTLEGQIMKYNQEHVDSSMVGGNQGNLRSAIVEVENANHNQENKNSSLEKGVINDADGGHHDEQSTARMTFTEKLSLFLSGRARMFSGKTLPKPMFSDIYNPPKNVHGEQMTAGWPSWLSAFAGEAINGWTPRRADSFEKIDKIGQGTFSNVYKARDTITRKIVALKKVRFDNLVPESVKFMAREILILRRLDHPNVIKLEGLVASRMSCSLYLVFEYMEHDLSGLASSPTIKFTEPQVKCYMHQLLSGLEHCHKRNVLHRDIKGSNLLLDNRGVLKIADFGSASLFDPKHKQPMTSRFVTLWYRPPELLLGATDYGVGVDLWSAGCILAELLAGKPIMPGRNEVEQLHKIYKLCGSPSDEYWKKSKLPHETIFKPQLSYKRCIAETFKDFPPSSLPLIETLLAIDPAERQTATAALRSEFFTTIPFACDPSSLPKYPPSKEMDAKLRDVEAGRLRAAGRSNADGVKKARTRDRAVRAIIPAPEANAELQANLDSKEQKSEKFPFSAANFSYRKAPMQTSSGPLVDPAAVGVPRRSKKDPQKNRNSAQTRQSENM